MGRDDRGFVAFVDAASPSLLRTAWLLCGDAALAEDLVQETLERVYVKWSRVQRDGRPTAYARTILVNLNTDRWRRTKKESLTRTGELHDSPAPSADHVEARDQVVRLLQTLPERERQVIVLRHYADMSERAVADALGVSLGTVKSSASRGLATLRAALATQEATS